MSSISLPGDTRVAKKRKRKEKEEERINKRKNQRRKRRRKSQRRRKMTTWDSASLTKHLVIILSSIHIRVFTG